MQLVGSQEYFVPQMIGTKDTSLHSLFVGTYSVFVWVSGDFMDRNNGISQVPLEFGPALQFGSPDILMRTSPLIEDRQALSYSSGVQDY